MRKEFYLGTAVAAAILCAPSQAQDPDAIEATAEIQEASTVEEVVKATDAQAATEAAEVVEYEANTEGLLPKVAADGCELHMWPAERMNSVTTGLLGGGLLDAALNSGTDANNKTLMASALDSPSQLDALQELDLRTLLGLTPGTTIVRHEEPLERKTMNRIKDRRADSDSSCYSELIVADVLYTKAMIYGRSLKTLFMVRNFGDDGKIDKQYKAWGGNGLKKFPPKEGEDALEGLDELNSVFQLNFEEYANNAKKRLSS
ncbi:hypothetical protein GCM10023115_11170 [Pontixanthobacter gangjinensis]|uniref:Uncharacterized protein n=1 Tax=Pontixanthobacter gangjinensis TaxID=1028742 RepID=A0A6I4SKX7_9SPHN|nr:hypothetical protein [Pontixanthobacter gangjinensis]MXO56363.1 hypothetical protein [Pontixanthobacter gangjinensis]